MHVGRSVGRGAEPLVLLVSGSRRAALDLLRWRTKADDHRRPNRHGIIPSPMQKYALADCVDHKPGACKRANHPSAAGASKLVASRSYRM